MSDNGNATDHQATAKERRKFTRVAFDTGVTLRQAEKAFHGYLVDISLNGLLVKIPDKFAIETESTLDASIILGSDAEIQMTVALAHSNHEFLGFRCVSIDMESISHLRRLIELNLEDSEAADRVLSELIDVHYQR